MGRLRFAGVLWLLCAASFPCLKAQTIEFESGGLKYQALTRSGLTIMFAELSAPVHDHTVMQVAVSNGSPSTRIIKPEDFRYEKADGTVLPAMPPRTVVGEFLTRGGRNDVIRLVSAYESGLYGLSKFNSTSGYEARRQQALAEVGSTKLKAAAAASAIVFVEARLKPGASTDGGVFFATNGKPLGPGKLIVTVGAERFVFEVGGDKHPGELKIR
jgi:hypothetical protein